MLHVNTCPLLFVIILLTHLGQCCYNVETSLLISKLLYWFLHKSNTGLKSVKLNSAKNAMTHMNFVCYEPC